MMMTVKELIEELKLENPDAEVGFTYNYGDHWRTAVVAKITRVTPAAVAWSEYHRMNKLVSPTLEEALGEIVDDRNTQEMVILSHGSIE